MSTFNNFYICIYRMSEKGGYAIIFLQNSKFILNCTPYKNTHYQTYFLPALMRNTHKSKNKYKTVIFNIHGEINV